MKDRLSSWYITLNTVLDDDSEVSVRLTKYFETVYDPVFETDVLKMLENLELSVIESRAATGLHQGVEERYKEDEKKRMSLDEIAFERQRINNWELESKYREMRFLLSTSTTCEMLLLYGRLLSIRSKTIF